MKTHQVKAFPAGPIELPEPASAVHGVLYRDSGGITQCVHPVTVDGAEVSATWPTDLHADPFIRVHYEPKQ